MEEGKKVKKKVNMEDENESQTGEYTDGKNNPETTVFEPFLLPLRRNKCVKTNDKGSARRKERYRARERKLLLLYFYFLFIAESLK